MKLPLIDRLGIGNARAVENAARHQREQRLEDELVESLVAALMRGEVATLPKPGVATVTAA